MEFLSYRSGYIPNLGSVRHLRTLATPLKLTVLCASIGAVLGNNGSAHAQEGIEEVVITGSRIVRRDLDAPSPILTVDTDAFEQSSNISPEYVLNQYPQFKADDTQFVASDIQPTANNSPGASTLNLRGLGAGRTLVLLDGRRAQPVNAALTVDVNTLPAAAISRVEVISGGAAATYGPDAMAGVVNFILKDDFEGVSLNYQTGWTDAGDGEESRIDGLIGGNFADGRGNAMVGIGYATRELAYELSRDFFAARMDDNGTGANYIRTDWPNYTPAGNNQPTLAAVNSVLPAGANMSRTAAFFVNPATGSVFRTTNALASGYDGPTDAPYLIRQHNGTLEQNNPRGWLSSPLERRMIFGRATYNMSDTISVFAQGLFNQSQVDQLLAPTPLANGAEVPRNRALEPAELQVLLDSRPLTGPGTGPEAPYTLARTLYWWPNRGSANDTDVNELVFGVEGELGSDWTWEAYHQNGSTTLTTRMSNFVWEDRYRELVAQPNFGRGGAITVAAANENTVTRTMPCTSGLPLLEPWVWGENYEIIYPSGFELSQDCIDAITVDMLQRNVVEQKVTEANFQGKLAELRAGELRGAFGVTNRVNYSLFEPDPLYIATEKAEGETEVSEVYGEILYPVFGRFELEIGARFSDFATGDWSFDAESYKALFNWVASDAWRFRGGWQRANRVPNVAELYAGQTSQVFGWGGTGDACMTNTLHTWGNIPANPNRAQAQELCRQLIYRSGGIPGQNDFDVQGASSYPSDGRALPHSYRLITGGNARLEPEVGDTTTLGFVWQLPGPDLSFSVDWYEIEIDNVIGSLGFLSAYEQCFNANGRSNPTFSIDNEYCARITRDPVNAEPLLVYGGNFNLSRRYTSGVDLSVQWTRDLAGGTFGVRSSANKLNTWQQPVLQEPDAPMLEYAGYGSDFELRVFTSLVYQRDRFDVGLSWRYLSDQLAGALVQTPTSTVLPTDAYNLFNLNASFNFNERLRLRGGIDNLLDEDPPLTGANPFHPTQPTNGTGNTDRGSYDVLGRRYYVGLAVAF
jgi:outer membrane receptor protein involved in Fe transport